MISPRLELYVAVEVEDSPGSYRLSAKSALPAVEV
jgi:hypothetical protein